MEYPPGNDRDADCDQSRQTLVGRGPRERERQSAEHQRGPDAVRKPELERRKWYREPGYRRRTDKPQRRLVRDQLTLGRLDEALVIDVRPARLLAHERSGLVGVEVEPHVFGFLP